MTARKKAADAALVKETITITRRPWWSHLPNITVEIECAADALPGVKLGMAVKIAFGRDAVLRDAVLSGAVLSGAVLSDADLRDADLSDADLRGADLRGAVLSGAVLSGAVLSDADLRGAVLSGAVLSDADLRDADLSGAVLRSYKADIWLTLSEIGGAMEAHHVIAKLRGGRVDGSTYGSLETECACLVGTIAQAKKVSASDLDRGSSRPAEQWFAMIRPGNKPGDDTGGGFAAQKALEWTEQWCVAHGYPVEPDVQGVAPSESPQ